MHKILIEPEFRVASNGIEIKREAELILNRSYISISKLFEISQRSTKGVKITIDQENRIKFDELTLSLYNQLKNPSDSSEKIFGIEKSLIKKLNDERFINSLIFYPVSDNVIIIEFSSEISDPIHFSLTSDKKLILKDDGAGGDGVKVKIPAGTA